MSAPNAQLLLIHDGELDDVRSLLDGIEVRYREVSPAAADLSDYLSFPVVISSPPYLLDRLAEGQVCEGKRIAVMEGGARTLRGMLSRGGVEWMVQRPVHPAALRLLLVHCLYKGPEKRKRKRVSMGAEVRLRIGWRKRDALLVDLSERDCRLHTSKRVSVGKRVKLQLPKDLTGDKVLNLEGRVVRNAESNSDKRPAEICLVFSGGTARDDTQLCQVVKRHSLGPAQLNSTDALDAERKRVREVKERRSLIDVDQLEPVEEPAEEPEGVSGRDRRGEDRHSFDRRVIALGEQAARVLVGRDISATAMRVDPTSALTVGQELRIAIHVSGHDTPLVLDVKVERDDDERGLLLFFQDLTPTAKEYLQTMIGELPSSSAGDPDGDEDGDVSDTLLVSEIVELRPSARSSTDSTDSPIAQRPRAKTPRRLLRG